MGRLLALSSPCFAAGGDPGCPGSHGKNWPGSWWLALAGAALPTIQLIGQDHKAVFGTGQPRGIIAYTAVARVKALASVARRPARVGGNREKK